MLKLAALGLIYGAGVNAFSAEVRQNVRSNFGQDRMISLPKSEVTDTVYEILSDFGADDLGHQNGALHFRLSPSAVAQLDDEGVAFSDLTEEFISNMEINLNSENFVCTDGAESCASSNDFHSSYQEFDAVHARMEALHNANPSTTSWVTLGQSFEGRDQKQLFIGDQSLPLVYYWCAIHAREWITPMFCTYMAETLLDSNNAVSRDLLSKFSFVITPVANPDGYVYSFERDNAWRKTRQPNPTNSRCPGTDPNRNWGRGWGGQGSSSNTCSDTFRGYAPFDQPCVANLKNFIDANANRLVHINDVHSYGEYWLAPFGYTTSPPADKARHDEVNRAVYDALLANSGVRWKVGPAATTIYVASGGSLDYIYEDVGVTHTYVYEARGGGRSGLAGFQPPTENIMPSNVEMFLGLVAALEVVEKQELRGIVPEPIAAPETVPEPEEENVPEETAEEEGSSVTDMSPLVGAIVFLGMVVAAMGAVLGFVVFKLQTQQKKKTVAVKGSEQMTHYELQ